jgi:hypothetical protein
VKEEIKLSVFAHDMILNPKYLKNTIKKFLDFINPLSKVAEHKIKTQKSAAFL